MTVVEFDKQHFTRDSAVVAFEDTNGITVDSDSGEAQFDWDNIETVTLKDVPWADSFHTDEFYVIPATVARPIKQDYQFGQDTITLMKPREELKKAAWSLDNAPWTLNHPDTGMIKNIDDIHGFWRNPRYIDSMDALKADLHVPVTDREGQAFLEQHGDVSVGFYNKVTKVGSYKGVVGGTDDRDGLDGFQTSLYFDHVASVPVGRCSSEQGCGLRDHAFISDTRTIGYNEDTMNDASRFVNPENDKWYAVPPSDNADGKWKFPVNNCKDAKDAWNLRGRGDMSISVETLEGRIKRRASQLGCELPSTAQDSDDEDCECGGPCCEEQNDITITMTDDDITFGLDDMSVNYIMENHDGVKSRINELEEQVSEATDAKEEMEKELQAAQDKAELLEEQNEELKEFKESHDSEKKSELIDEIVERTDRWDADSLAEQDLEDVQNKHELVMELTADEKVANGGDEGGEQEQVSVPTRQTPWE